MAGRSRWRAGGAVIGLALIASSVAAEGMTRWGWSHRWSHRHHRHQPAARWSSYGATNMPGWSTGALSAQDAAGLRPGQYIWQGTPGIGHPVSMIIDLVRQVGYVYQGGTLVGITTVSTGRRHHETPAGTFPILQKAVWHRSTIYSGAPMPYMQRLTWSGIALHAGGVPGYRQSHGCIHLPPPFARALFGVTTLGAVVQIMHGGPVVAPSPYQAVAARMPTTAEAVAMMTRSLL